MPVNSPVDVAVRWRSLERRGRANRVGFLAGILLFLTVISLPIVLPAISAPVRFIALYQTLSLMTTYEYILLITSGGPVYDSTPYALYIYRRAFENGAYAYGAALALGLMAIGVVFTLIQWRLSNMGETFATPKIEVL